MNMNEQPNHTQQQPAPPQNQQPLPPQLTPEQEAQRKLTNKRKLIWGLVLLIGPSLLIPVSIVAYAIVNFAIGGVDTGSMQDGPSVGRTIANIVLYLVGAVAVLTWLPGIIVGIVLLATRK